MISNFAKKATRIIDMLRLGFFASHNGSNMQAIIDACRNKTLNAVPALVISNNSDSFALKRAKSEHIPHYHISSAQFPNSADFTKEILKVLDLHAVDLIVLAGYMKQLDSSIIRKYKNRILNIHPALLPKYGGKGMYGMNVHRTVLESREQYTGITIHLVDEIYDHGKILNQIKIPVSPDDTSESLSKKVLEQEHRFYVETILKIISGEITLK